MTALNPNHPVMQAAEGQWYKLAALLLRKLPDANALITAEDISALVDMFDGEEPVIVVHDKPDGLHLFMVPRSRADQLARQAGGLPV